MEHACFTEVRHGGLRSWVVGIGEDGTTNGTSSRCLPKRDTPDEAENNSQRTDRDGRRPPFIHRRDSVSPGSIQPKVHLSHKSACSEC